jgi:hypothetical protein
MSRYRLISNTPQLLGAFFLLFIFFNCSEKEAKPRFFDVRVNDEMYKNAEVIKPWRTIKLDSALAGTWIVAGDVNNDGKPEIVSARNVNVKDDHYTSSVVVYNLEGNIVWQWGDVAKGRNVLHHDVACQIYDWDGNGINDVIVAADKFLIELDGITGKVKRQIPIPEKASDCIVFANLSGNERATDVIVKNRYHNIWAYNEKGEELWMVEKPVGKKTAHRPVPVDIDNDGKDEIMAGYALLNSDGTVRWDILDSGIKFHRGHLDCADEFPKTDSKEETKLAITCCGDNCVALLDSKGEVIWKREGHHFESIDIGKVYDNVPGYQIVVDIDHRPFGKSPLWVLSDKGELLGQIITNYSRHHLLVDWYGEGVEEIIIGGAAAMFNGNGEMVARFDMPDFYKRSFMCYKGEMTGDGVPDIIFSTDPAQEIYIFKNPGKKKPAKKSPLGTGVNFTLY